MKLRTADREEEEMKEQRERREWRRCEPRSTGRNGNNCLQEEPFSRVLQRFCDDNSYIKLRYR